MRSTTSRYWILLAAVLALPIYATSASAHSYSHHSLYRHHRARLASAHRRRLARPLYASAEQLYAPRQYFNAPNAAVAMPQWNSQWDSGGSGAPGTGYQGLVAEQASANGVPASLVHRVIMRESRYNPRAVSRGNYGIMQIRLGTARAMGYTGSAAGLLDPSVNMTYAVRYLAGAYRAAGGNENRAVALYARGYYQQAKAQGFSPYGSQGYSRYGSGPQASMTASPSANTLYAWAAPTSENPVLVRGRHHRRSAT